MCPSSQSIGIGNWKLTQTAAKTFSVAIFWVNKKYCGKSHRNCPSGPDLPGSYWLRMPFQPYHWLPVSNNPSLRNARRVFLARCYITQSFRVIALEIHTSISFYSPQGLGRGHSLPLLPQLTRHLNIETQDCESLNCQAKFCFGIALWMKERKYKNLKHLVSTS